MQTILLVENDKAWVDRLEKLLPQVLGETGQLQDITTRNDSIDFEEFDSNNAGIALVDLELGPGTNTRVSDFGGRDRVMPALRERARWIPIVLVTQYISGDETLLADLTVADFDAILTKSFFGNTATNPNRWQTFRKKVAIRRVASLTGRSPHIVEALLEQPINLEYGRGVKSVFEQFGTERMQCLLKLLDFGAPRLVLDEVVQGHSGVIVLKVTCSGTDRSTKWLVKCGTSIDKIDREAKAHYKLFVDGFTRKMSVPMLRWAPVVWEGVGGIAYEFEEGAETLLDIANREGTENALKKAGPALERLFEGAHIDSVVPIAYFQSAFGDSQSTDIKTGLYSQVAASLLGTKEDQFADRSIRLRVGCQHGDLHSRNILMTADGPVLIDFAHYVPSRERGVPLLDLAKLVFDLSVFSTPEWPMEDLFSGRVLTNSTLSSLAARCRAIEAEVVNEHELTFFAWAACCLANRYLGYPDVSEDTKQRILYALQRA